MEQAIDTKVNVIVKVQSPIETNEPVPYWLVYDKGKDVALQIPEEAIPKKLKKAHRFPVNKTFWYAKVLQLEDNIDIEFDNRAPYQAW